MKAPTEKLSDAEKLSKESERRVQLRYYETVAALSMVTSALCSLPPVAEHVVNGVLSDLEKADWIGFKVTFSRDQKPYKAEVSRVRYIKNPIPKSLRWSVFERDNFTCQYCGSRRFLAADHKHPESKGGETTLENLITACESCNQSKGRKTYEEFTCNK